MGCLVVFEGMTTNLRSCAKGSQSRFEGFCSLQKKLSDFTDQTAIGSGKVHPRGGIGCKAKFIRFPLNLMEFQQISFVNVLS